MVAFWGAPSDLHKNQVVEDILLGWWVLLGIIRTKGVRGGGGDRV